MDEYKLSASEIVALKLLHRSLKKKREADRVKVVYSLGSGIDVDTLAFILDVDADTIKSYFTRYQQLGKDNFYQLHCTGKAPYLTQEQQDQFSRYVEKHFNLRSVDFSVYIKKEFKVAYKPTAVKELLHKLNFTYHKPKHFPGKCDPQEQEKFIEEYRLLRKKIR
jgi:transposase